MLPSTHSTPQPIRHAGFTITELVAVIAIIAVLAAVALPRFTDRSSFDSIGFADQTRAALQFARKSAVAARRQVCVAVAANTLSITRSTSAGSGACNAALLDPARGTAFVLAAPAGIALAASGPIAFDPLGRPLGAASITVSVSGDPSRTLTIERETGHVH
jgi:MSHA pilin protein MshC